MFAGLDFTQAHPARRWTTWASFTAQALLVAVTLLLPVLYPRGLPEALVRRPIFVPVSGAEVPDRPLHNTGAVGTVHSLPFIVTRDNGVHFTARSSYVDGPEPPSLCVSCGGPPSGVFNPIEGTQPIQPVLRTAPPRVYRQSQMMEGRLLQRVEPRYPPIAIQTRTEGSVVIRAVIGHDGLIENAQIVSGHPLLARAALDAVRQWKYRPYYLNGEPVEVETEITVNFTLQR